MRMHKGDLWSDPHMLNFQQEHWPAEVPEFFSVETVWAQASLAALRRAGGADLSRFNLARLYSLLLLHHPDHARDILHSASVARKHDGAPRLAWHRFAITLVASTASHFSGALRKLTRKAVGARGVSTRDAGSIVEASELVRMQLGAAA